MLKTIAALYNVIVAGSDSNQITGKCLEEISFLKNRPKYFLQKYTICF